MMEMIPVIDVNTHSKTFIFVPESDVEPIPLSLGILTLVLLIASPARCCTRTPCCVPGGEAQQEEEQGKGVESQAASVAQVPCEGVDGCSRVWCNLQPQPLQVQCWGNEKVCQGPAGLGPVLWCSSVSDVPRIQTKQGRGLRRLLTSQSGSGLWSPFLRQAAINRSARV